MAIAKRHEDSPIQGGLSDTPGHEDSPMQGGLSDTPGDGHRTISQKVFVLDNGKKKKPGCDGSHLKSQLARVGVRVGALAGRSL